MCLNASDWREEFKMGLFKKVFGGGGAEEPQFEVVENQLCTDLTRYQVRVRKDGQEIYAEELFQAAANPKDLKFGRFYLLNENPPKLHFAPSLNQAVSWFRGRDLTKDGYYHIFWGEGITYQCGVCKKESRVPLTITRVERLSVYTSLPNYMAIVGWRVIEVASDLMGLGVPSKILDMFKTKPIIRWDSGKSNHICEDCAQRLSEMRRMRRQEVPEDYRI
jgi:hypothetical protein